MEEFRILNRRPLELPPLDTDVPLIGISFKRYDNNQVRNQLRKMPDLLYNPHSGWYFALSDKSIWKMTNEQEVNKDEMAALHLSAVANLDALVTQAVLGYSKSEPRNRINSFGRNVAGNIDIKAIHRFYAGAWINQKPYSVRLLIREFHDGRVELGEEAKAYALNLKEMRTLVSGTSVPPASHGLTTAHRYKHPIKEPATGIISVLSSRCGQTPPTDAILMDTNVQPIREIVKVPLKLLIESNLKEGEELLYRQREAFKYSMTGTNHLETLFDRMRLTNEERCRLYKGETVMLHNIKFRGTKTNASLLLKNGVLKLIPLQAQQPQPGNRHLKF